MVYLSRNEEANRRSASSLLRAGYLKHNVPLKFSCLGGSRQATPGQDLNVSLFVELINKNFGGPLR
jgi:hypothetical protein